MNARTIRSTSAAMSWADGNGSDGCVSTCCGLASGDASVRTLIEVAHSMVAAGRPEGPGSDGLGKADHGPAFFGYRKDAGRSEKSCPNRGGA